MSITYFEKMLSNIVKECNFIFVFKLSLFYRLSFSLCYYEKQRDLISNLFLHYQMLSVRSFLYLVIHLLTNFDDLFLRDFWVIQKITIHNLCKPFHDVIIFPFSFGCCKPPSADKFFHYGGTSLLHQIFPLPIKVLVSSIVTWNGLLKSKKVIKILTAKLVNIQGTLKNIFYLWRIFLQDFTIHNYKSLL